MNTTNVRKVDRKGIKRVILKTLGLRDAFMFSGLVMVTTGCVLYSPPLGLIVSGVLLFYLGVWHK